MSHVLIINEDKVFGNTLKALIEKSYGIKTLFFIDSIEAFTVLDIMNDVEVIVCKEKNTIELCEYLVNSYEEEVYVLILGDDKTNYPKATPIPVSTNQSKIKQHIGFFLGKEEAVPDYHNQDQVASVTSITENSPVADAKKSPPEIHGTSSSLLKIPGTEKNWISEKFISGSISNYTSINMKYLIEIPNIQIDFNIYSRIRRDDGFDYSIKYAKNSVMTKTDVERLITRGVKELFIESSEYERVHEIVSLNFLKRFKDPALSIYDKMQLSSDGFEILLDTFKNLTVDKYSVGIIKEMIRLLTEFTNVETAIDDFTKCQMQKKLSYGYSHLHLTCIIIFQILDQVTWSRGQSKNKIIYLSLFHDMALHNDRLIKHHHNRHHHHYGPGLNTLSAEENLILHNHAEVAATILENYIKAPKELTAVVREHHGLKSGKGFLDSLSVGISPLTMMFIVVEYFTSRYLEHSEKPENLEKVVSNETLEHEFNEMELRFDRLTYLEVVIALRKIFKDR